MKALSNIEINLDEVQEGLRLWLDARIPNSLFDLAENALENNEARYQLLEGCFYDFELGFMGKGNLADSLYMLGDVGENILQKHSRTPNLGTIAPNIFVGTLTIPLLNKATEAVVFSIELEVQSIKSSYRDDYRDMLELITNKCTDLLLQANSPVNQHFDVDYTQDSQTLYQKFAFIKSVAGTDDFSAAIHRIVTAPVTKWKEINETKDISNSRRLSNFNLKQIAKGSKRIPLPMEHHLRRYGIDTLPDRIEAIRKTDSIDTPENRFIKHALEIFLKFTTDIQNTSIKFGHRKMVSESAMLVQSLESHLQHAVFKEISRPTTLRLNSPVLQRKEGYREVLRVWLMFDLAAKLIWKGGNKVYSGGKKDIATLYEYWLFFKLLDLFQSIFTLEPKDVSELIKETADGLNLELMQGKCTVVRGTYDSGQRKLHIQFNYNRTFGGKNKYPNSGSWTTILRPDYTLSFWPYGISEQEAEIQELIVHVHFDAKYKIANLTDFMPNNTAAELDEEKLANKKGVYKNADLLKMHAYKDAIRRTGGAYVLYPGNQSINQRGFHEIVPGLGAFPVKPSKTDSGIGELKAFILEVIEHFIHRSSQREKMALRTFEIYKDPPAFNRKVDSKLPEAYHSNRDLIPDDISVLVCVYKSAEHLSWIKRNKLYNFRMNMDRGALVLTAETMSSKFVLLHSTSDTQSSELWRVVGAGFRLTSAKTLRRLNYPDPRHTDYLLVKIAEVEDPEFKNIAWDFTQLKNYPKGKNSSFPFTASLSELMNKKIRQHFNPHPARGRD